MASAPPFTGFTPDAIQFLADLAQHNDRAWFTPRKAEFERLLRAPMAALIVALADRFADRGVPLLADPARSPFRIYRDTRFSRDKSPYKTQVSAVFPWSEARTVAAFHEHGNPGGYFHLAPGDIYVGGGIWRPPTPVITAFRRSVVEEPARIRRILDAAPFRDTFGAVSGDRLTRVPAGFPATHPEAQLLLLKDVTFGRRLADADVGSPALVDVIVDTLEAAVPLMRYLAGVAPADGADAPGPDRGAR